VAPVAWCRRDLSAMMVMYSLAPEMSPAAAEVCRPGSRKGARHYGCQRRHDGHEFRSPAGLAPFPGRSESDATRLCKRVTYDADSSGDSGPRRHAAGVESPRLLPFSPGSGVKWCHRPARSLQAPRARAATAPSPTAGPP
jgi:hypothetical protein